jgi:hypothetical protein
MSAQHHLDVTTMELAAALIFAAKATRYLSRGTTADVVVADNNAVAEFTAWAAWAGHGERSGPDPLTVTLLVREGRPDSVW